MKHEKQQEDWKEGRRRRARELKEQGWKQKDIAAEFCVPSSTVCRSPAREMRWLSSAGKTSTGLL